MLSERYILRFCRASEKRKVSKNKHRKKRVRSPRSEPRKTTKETLRKKPASGKPKKSSQKPTQKKTRSRAARLGWETRRKKQREEAKKARARSKAARLGWETRRKNEAARARTARARAKKAANTRKKRLRPTRREVESKIRRLEKEKENLERARQVERRRRERAERELEKLRKERKPIREKKFLEQVRKQRAAERLRREQEQIDRERRELILAQERLLRHAKAIPTSKKEQDEWYRENFERLKARFYELLEQARRHGQIRSPRDGFRFRKIDSPKTKGYMLSVSIGLELSESNLEEILYRVSQAARVIAGRSRHRYANWMTSFYISSLAPDIKGYGFEKLATPDPDAWRFQTQGILPTGLWSSRVSMHEKARAILETEMSAEHTIIYVHYATVSYHDRKTEQEQLDFIRRKRRERRKGGSR
jgi:hypothetical protein